MNLSVALSEKIDRKKISMEMDIHVKEVTISNHLISLLKEKLIPHVRAYIFLAIPVNSIVNGAKTEIGERYKHPFLVVVNQQTGELVDLLSTVNDQKIIKEYLSFFDLFQYAQRSGEYQYRNGNGYYQANIEKSENSNHTFDKVNLGYSDNNTRLLLSQSLFSFSIDPSKANCFYQQANGVETIRSVLSKDAYVDATVNFSIRLDDSLSLPAGHYFYSLTDSLESWPGYIDKPKISQQQAMKELAILLKKLSGTLNNKASFLAEMKSRSDLWPFLADYLSQYEMDDKLSSKIIWSLDRINSIDSVSALAKMIATPLSRKNSYRAVMALVSTSAALSPESLQILKNHVIDMMYTTPGNNESLLLVRALGAIASRRRVQSPLQSEDIKQFIYHQANNSEGKLQASWFMAIGNLGKSIDETGLEILISGLIQESVITKQSAWIALEQIPYVSANSQFYIEKIQSEKNPETRGIILDLLGKAARTDDIVKKQLLSVVTKSNNRSIRNHSLNSLKKINYSLGKEDRVLLEKQLRKETDNNNQKLLASLILRARRLH
ncbi:MAG TPA: hypothetical protein ENJ60_13205 [Aeromonadales bacterium]|nr:hypothetical protein [Aeromonadales bacterium]